MRDFLTTVRTSPLFPPAAVRFTERNVANASSTSHMNEVHRRLHALFNSLHSANRLLTKDFSTEPLVPAPAPTAPLAAAAATRETQRHPTTQSSTAPAASTYRPQRGYTPLQAATRAAPVDTAPYRPVYQASDIRDTAWGGAQAAAGGSAPDPPRQLQQRTTRAGSAANGGAKRPRAPSPQLTGYIPLTKASYELPPPKAASPRKSKRARREEARAARAEKNKKSAKAKKAGGGVAAAGVGVDPASKAARARRFKDDHRVLRSAQGSGKASGYGSIVFQTSEWGEGMDLDSAVAVCGTSTALEKAYFRLNVPPQPEDVRSRQALASALEHVLGLFKAGERTYLWLSDQLKGIRQDCVVQHLDDAFVVRVYETHAREAVAHGDMVEFNQCLAQLRQLSTPQGPACLAEFAGYEVLHAVVKDDATDTLATLRSLTPAQLASPEVRHANAVRLAVETCNVGAFVRLRGCAPHHGAHIMDQAAHRIRNAALTSLVHAFRTDLPLSFVQGLLGLPSASSTVRFVEHCGGVVKGWRGGRPWAEGGGVLDAAASGDTAPHKAVLGGEGAAEDPAWASGAVLDVRASGRSVKTVKPLEHLVANRLV